MISEKKIVWQLLECFDVATSKICKGVHTPVMYLHFQTAFDKAPTMIIKRN